MDINNIHNVCGFVLNYRLVSFLVRKIPDWQEIGQLEPLSKNTAPSRDRFSTMGASNLTAKGKPLAHSSPMN
jgi:hypothetical protein